MDDKTISVLQSMADQLHVAVDYLWPALVRYTYADSLVGVILGVFLLILGLSLLSVGLTVTHQAWVEAKALDVAMKGQGAYHRESDSTDFVCVATIVVFFSGLSILGAVICLGTSLAGVIAPEGTTVMHLLQKIH